MGFFAEESGLIITHLLYKTAVLLALAVLRWVLSWALKFGNRTLFPISSDFPNHTSSSSSSSSHSLVSSQMIRDSLVLTTFGDVKERVTWVADTCAVCLSQLREQDLVRELRNCCHVYHRDCIDSWVDYDQDEDQDNNHKTCPLCRAPLLTASQVVGWARNEPSWAVERILYLFGDDLLM
ncbi:zf-RING_2 domain-containing protein [Cephalotus follicularis]|uniref:Zf-RING_2 domain-containing protein n=1 Tax=Cephalotus follicularis TaxID=3775 RepID=A0A1Q3CKE2_CEPFO|nr:zf-RING_2 domain-containing protein [Cephalotus follicularis]